MFVKNTLLRFVFIARPVLFSDCDHYSIYSKGTCNSGSICSCAYISYNLDGSVLCINAYIIFLLRCSHEGENCKKRLNFYGFLMKHNAYWPRTLISGLALHTLI